jgi:hypothetical protein
MNEYVCVHEPGVRVGIANVAGGFVILVRINIVGPQEEVTGAKQGHAHNK